MLKTYWDDLLDPKDPLVSVRQKGWDLFEKIGLPKAKQEAFQYLSKKFKFPKLAERKEVNGEGSNALYFIDGFFEPSLTKPLTDIVCLPLDQAMKSYGLFLQNRMNRSLKSETDPFAALNIAFQGRGCFLYVPPNCKAALHLTQTFTGDEMANPRLNVYLGRGAELALTQSSIGQSGLCNGMIDFVLDEGANFSFFDSHNGHFQSIRGTVKRDGKFKAVLTGKTTRNSIHIDLAEENGEAEIFGLSRLNGEEESHIHVNMEHSAPHTRSRQHFKSVLLGQSRFSFEGKIYVHPIAQKTEAYQLNNNLLLSDEAATHAKPNLEIFADDVKASHGATIGRLDEEQLFYLRSRGLSLQEATEWLVQGFCGEILDRAK